MNAIPSEPITAESMAKAIDANAAAFWNREKTYEEFSAQSRELWNQIIDRGLSESVLPLLAVNKKGA